MRTDVATDVELLEAWRAGDRHAGEALFERHFRSVYRFFRTKGVEAVDDLVQQTFLGCVEGRDRLRSEASFRTYMFAVARNQLFRHWKQRGAVRDDAEFESRSLHDMSPTASKVLVRRAEERALLEALRRIPVVFQIALELYYFENMRGPEIAAVLDVPEATVRSRLRRGTEHLRRQLEAVAESPDVLHSTLTNLDEWARGVRVHVEPATA
jgi:RNA polymerase sigma factor (sigma-70 family)